MSRLTVLLANAFSASEPPLELGQVPDPLDLGDVRCASITVRAQYVVTKLDMRPDGALVCAFTGVEVSPAPDPLDSGTW
jgi:hypothetical protein